MKYEVREVKKQREELQQAVKDVEEKQVVWIQKSEGSVDSMKKIIDEQRKEKKEIRDKVINVIREEKKLVRDTVDKVKCLVVFGMKEEKIVNRIDREAKEKERIRKILAKATEDENVILTSVEEFFRIGKFKENKQRPVKINL